MALIKCPECKQSISDKALKCPKCGYPIQEYLSRKAEETQWERVNNTSVNTESFVDIQQAETQKKSNKKLFIVLFAVCVFVVAALAVVFNSNLFAPKLIVEDISISKWRLTEASDYGDYYEGIITSEQKNPFIAVIAEYGDEENIPQLVYVNDGKGVIKTYEATDEDPSIKYRPMGYLGGVSVDTSDIKVKYKDSDYNDWLYLDSTSCDVLISVDVNNSKNGLLVFDLINETNNETERNMIAAVVNGKSEYSYYAELPYKSRGLDISIVPKLFCESNVAIKQEDYVIEKAYTAEKNAGKYYTSYLGEETLAFANYNDGFIIYTRELKEGGNKENRNIVKSLRAFLHNGECTLETYDSVGEGKTILMPEYEFNIIGYITWTPLEKETI